VVFCPKYRRKVLTGEIAERLKAIIHEVAAELESEIMELETMPDHVHILCEVPPHHGIAKSRHRQITASPNHGIAKSRHRQVCSVLQRPFLPRSA
jgi:REP element-mobilizing transposase RayT